MPSTKKVLTVDDSMLSRVRFIAGPLREAGYEVVEAVNGQDGLEAVVLHQPDCVLTDLLMPVLDGFGFLEALRGRGDTTPVIVASADIQQTTRERVERLGVSGFLTKPFNKAELLQAVSQALASGHAVEAASCN